MTATAKKKDYSGLNRELQDYKGLPLRLIARPDYEFKNAKRYIINETNQNVWIPNKCLEVDGTIKRNINLSFIFDTKQGKRKLELAGYKVK